MDRVHIIGVREAVASGPLALVDHDPVEDILLGGKEHVRDLADLLTIAAVDRRARIQHLIGDR